MNGEASFASPRTPAAPPKQRPQAKKCGRKPAKANTERRRSVNGAHHIDAPSGRRQSVVTKGGFLVRAEDEDGDPEEEAKATMARSDLHNKILSADWSTVIECATEMATSRPAELGSKMKAGDAGFGSDHDKARRRADAQLRQERPDTAAEKSTQKEDLLPGVYAGHGQLRVPVITTAGVQANMPLIDGGPRKSTRWQTKLTDRDVVQRETPQSNGPTSWYQKPPPGAKQQLAEVELPPDEQEDGVPKEEDRREYLKWRKKVIECARSMALEVDRFRSVMQ